jgi:hypothetical protein
VAATAKSAAQLLLDQTARGGHISHLQATLKNLGDEQGVSFTLRDAAGTGTAEMQLSRPGNAQPSNCSAYNPGVLACRTYLLPGGVKVEESLSPPGAKGPAGQMYMITVVEWQPHHGASGSFSSMNYSLVGHNGKLTAAPPVPMKQLVAAALDPRWGWRMNQGFVAQAAHLKLGGDSGKVWH